MPSVNSNSVTPIARESSINIIEPPTSSQVLAHATNELQNLSQELERANQRTAHFHRSLERVKSNYRRTLAQPNKRRKSIASQRIIVKILNDKLGVKAPSVDPKSPARSDPVSNPYSTPPPGKHSCSSQVLAHTTKELQNL